MKTLQELREIFQEWLESPQENLVLHSSEIASILRNSFHKDKNLFFKYVAKIENRFLGEIILELPEKLKNEVIEFLSSKDLAEATNSLESDDATDLIQDIKDISEKKVEQVLSLLSQDDKDEINRLLKYEQNQAGAWMQTEFFFAFINDTVSDAIERLKELKSIGELDEVYQLFIMDNNLRILGNMKIDNLLIQDFDTKFSTIIQDLDYQDISVFATDDIKVVSRKFEEYNLQVVPVLDENGKMIGRITSDDAYDIISEIATEQVYNMAGVDDEVEEEANLKEIIKTRAFWLFLNLFTAVLASLVISFFDTTLQALIPLAILMPIVASMGGNAGTQTLTVVVRQLALGEIEKGDGQNAIKREVIISLINGFVFAIIISIITYFWFGNVMLGVVIAVAMVINLFIAGLFGSVIPLLLERFKIDPAIGSTVLLTTATDIFGFFVFLGLAKLILIG